MNILKTETLTNGVATGNRIFISGSPEDTYTNLTKRKEPLSVNDPKSLEETRLMSIKQEKAEKLIAKINEKEKTNIIKVKNRRVEDEKEKDIQLEKIAEEIINKLKLQKHE